MDTTPVKCTFEDVDADDLLDAISTMNSHVQSMDRLASIASLGVQAIDWAVEEVEAAIDADLPTRHMVHAVLDARRALASWVDTYRDCFGFSLCKNPPQNSRESTDLLVRRGVIDQLSARVIQRAIERRNIIEHDYENVTLEEAQDSVELIRLTLHRLNRNDPEEFHWVSSPWLLGDYSYAWRGSKAGTEVNFRWDGISFVLGSFFNPPWLGVVEPTGEKEAHVRKCEYGSTQLDVYEQILSEAEKRCSSGGGHGDCMPFALAAGLIDRP